MDMLNWYKKHNVSLEAINSIEDLRKNKPYTDEEIIFAIETVYRVSSKCGVTFEQAIALVTANESEWMQWKKLRP